MNQYSITFDSYYHCLQSLSLHVGKEAESLKKDSSVQKIKDCLREVDKLSQLFYQKLPNDSLQVKSLFKEFYPIVTRCNQQRKLLKSLLPQEQPDHYETFPRILAAYAHPGVYIKSASNWITNENAISRRLVAENSGVDAETFRKIYTEATQELTVSNVISSDSRIGTQYDLRDRWLLEHAMEVIEKEQWLRQPLINVSNQEWKRRLCRLAGSLGLEAYYGHAAPVLQYRKAPGGVAKILNSANHSQINVMDWLQKNDTPSFHTFQNLMTRIGFAESALGPGVKVFLSLITELKQKIELTNEEIAFVDKYVYIPPEPEQIEPKMNELFDLIYRYLRNQEDPIIIAAAFHSGIVNIHPFDDCNGRIARLVMNFVLMANGIEPKPIRFNKPYEQAVHLSQYAPGAFAQYVRDLVNDPNEG